jgi:aminopeptidase N
MVVLAAALSAVLALAVIVAGAQAHGTGGDGATRPTHSAPNVDAPPAGPLAEVSRRSARAAKKGGHGHGEYVAGARSLGDTLFPQIGNGGYDVRSYEIELDYDPEANVFERGTETEIEARATQNLREFSLDFQDLDVSRVEVNGRRADFEQIEATPDLSDIPEVTQPMKLVVTPKGKARPRAGKKFEVEVSYSGAPEHITDPDTSIEGWIQACYPLDPPQTCDGAFVVNEPIGAQSWFPSNNYPTDKASFETEVTVPDGKTAFGVGELASRKLNKDGTRTWRWVEDDPTATYLTTATVGDFDNSFFRMSSSGKRLDVYNSIDSSATPDQVAAINATLDRVPEMLGFLIDRLGPYPFDSTGAVADRAAGVGYALEVQTKPHYAGGFTSGNPGINSTIHLHELAHMWIGDSVTLATWHEIWFNEGWATWFEWAWEFEDGTGDSPPEVFDAIYNDPAFDWSVAPAVLDNDPANLFHFDPVYQRPAMMLEGYRQIVGDERFFDFARALVDEFGYGNISLNEFVDLAKDFSGLEGEQLELLDDYFQEWLFLEAQPTILPEDF